MSEIRDSIRVQTTESVNDIHLKKYMMKVYNYMTVGLLCTAFFGYLIANTPLEQLFFKPVVTEQGTYMGMTIIGWISIFLPVVMVLLINPILAAGKLRAGLAVFMLFSALMGVSIANILLTYTGASITRIFVVSAAMFAATSFYGSVTKKDLTSFGSFLFMGLIGIIIAMLVNLFLQSPVLYYVYTIIGVFIFLGLTAYDTQKIKASYVASDGTSIMHSKAIMGALSLYLDFINLFIMLLSLFGDRK